MVSRLGQRCLSSATAHLKNSPLWHTSGFINGQFIPISSGQELFEVKNPSDGQVIARVQNMYREHTLEAIEAASLAWKSWKLTIGMERSRYLLKIISLTQKHKEDLSRIITLESGTLDSTLA